MAFLPLYVVVTKLSVKTTMVVLQNWLVIKKLTNVSILVQLSHVEKGHAEPKITNPFVIANLGSNPQMANVLI